MEKSSMKQIDISVVILNFNTKELTDTCIKRLKQSRLGSHTLEIILCDNASSDGTTDLVKEKYSDVTIIQNGKNLGFAAGNNPGIARARGRYIVLLNSDTEVSEDTMSEMIAFMDTHHKAGAATCKLVLPSGIMDPACHRGFPTPWASLTYLTKLEKLFPKSTLFGGYHQGYKDLSTAHEVDCISGAFFMVRKETTADVGLLDEDYFMYGEDIDWAFRIKQKGWQIWFNPKTTVLHKKKQSGRAHDDKKRRITTEIYFHTYNWLFYKKYYAKKYGPVISGLINAFYTLRISLLKQLSL
jgi:GT2 family glycosyltransferase